jgi:alpha 1,2-mannosyltransferase
MTTVTYGEAHDAQRRAVLSFARQPRSFAGRGIVTAAYDREFASLWVLLSELARLKVDLPVEAFHGRNELSAENAALLTRFDLDLKVRALPDPVERFATKPFAIYRSAFQEVLWIDCDNFPIRDPSSLFDDPEYRAKGSLFWRDVSGVDRATLWHPASQVWTVFNVPPNDSEEFESGQLLIDKARCWPELGLTLHYAAESRLYGTMVHGDKDMFRLAWQNLAASRKKAPPSADYLGDPDKVPYGFMPYGPFHMGRPNPKHKWGGGTVMVQRDRRGAALFNHHNFDKFHETGDDNVFNADIANEAIYHEHIARLRKLRAEARASAPAGR